MELNADTTIWMRKTGGPAMRCLKEQIAYALTLGYLECDPPSAGPSEGVGAHNSDGAGSTPASATTPDHLTPVQIVRGGRKQVRP